MGKSRPFLAFLLIATIAAVVILAMQQGGAPLRSSPAESPAVSPTVMKEGVTATRDEADDLTIPPTSDVADRPLREEAASNPASRSEPGVKAPRSCHASVGQMMWEGIDVDHETELQDEESWERIDTTWKQMTAECKALEKSRARVAESLIWPRFENGEYVTFHTRSLKPGERDPDAPADLWEAQGNREDWISNQYIGDGHGGMTVRHVRIRLGENAELDRRTLAWTRALDRRAAVIQGLIRAHQVAPQGR